MLFRSKGKLDDDFDKAEDQRVADQVPAIVEGKETLEIEQSDPRALPDGHVEAEFLEGQNVAGHGDIGKDGIGNQTGQQKQVQCPVAVD